MNPAIETMKALGLTEEQIIDKLITKMSSDLLDGGLDEEADDEFASRVRAKTMRKLNEQIERQITATVTKIGDEEIAPRVEDLIRGFELQATTTWGEKKGTPISFTEYLVQRAAAYVQEPVDHHGKNKAESSSSYFTGSSTRIAYMIDKHLQYSIQQAIQQAVADLNTSVAKGLHKSVLDAINSVTSKLKVDVKI